MTVTSLDADPDPPTPIAKLHRFYPASITVPHYQLRNFISTVYENVIFFVNNFDVFRLDVQSKERSLVATVPFEARCLAAKHGWICVGGETKGDCAFIFVGEQDGQPGCFCHDLFLDMLGKEIVNSMTIHRLQSPPDQPDKRDEIVALISNNDKTVTVYSLSQRLILSTLIHPNAMNYATISPDGQLLVAVGDENAAYFYLRKPADVPLARKDASDKYLAYDWILIAVPCVPTGEEEMDDYSFSVAFSPSGHLCATSSQDGGITVFDVDAILDGVHPAEDTILASFRSSRPTVYGCVRSMAFSPNPWDVLAWTEDHGRIGLADVRTCFARRQAFTLSKRNATTVHIHDTLPEEWTDLGVKERLTRQHHARLAAVRGLPPVGARSLLDASHSVPTTLPGETSHHPAQDSLEHDASFSARERAILQALETTMAEQGNAVPGPFSINYTSHPTVRSSASLGDDQTRDTPLLSLSAGRLPRRRSSVVLSEMPSRQQLLSVDDGARATMTASPGPMSDDGLAPPMSTNDLTPSQGSSSQPMPYNIPVSDPWHVIERTLRQQAEARSIARQHVPLSQIEAAIIAERQISNRLENQLRDERRLSILLRQELEARERLLQARRQELQQVRASSPVDYSLHGLLGADRENTSSQLSSSIDELVQLERNSQARAEQTLSQQHPFGSSFLLSQSINNSLLPQSEEQQQSSQRLQANGSTDPTTSQGMPPTTPAISSDLERTLRTLEEERRVRRQRIYAIEAQRIYDNEAQAGRAESRRSMSSSQANAAGSAAEAQGSQRWSSDGRPIPPRTGDDNPSQTSSTTQRATVATNTNVGPTTPRTSAPPPWTPTSPPTQRALPHPREARRLLQQAAMDGNGNWQSSAFQRAVAGRLYTMVARPASMGATSSNAFQNYEPRPPDAVNRSAAGTGTLEDMIGETGLGTAGIGWSTDGLRLFVGSTDGIFEFNLNVQDRCQIPDLTMR